VGGKKERKEEGEFERKRGGKKERKEGERRGFWEIEKGREV
jgi:hypothetical protein